ncbi:hypothetical protein [Rhodococcus erythropolis]|uniref:hypothetical protein n=1 Tax=Rhodococcus erythropolis TaxID=1833 RepID=UPI00366CE98F
MPPTHSSQADAAAAYRTLIAHETEPKEQDFYRTRLQRLEQATEPVCEFDCRNRVAAAGVGVYCPQCSAKCADTDLTTQLAKAIRAAWLDRLDWDELAQGALEFLTSTGRLLAADGLVLAGAEKAALERLLAAQTGIVSRDVYEAIECLRALFPAAEPAEERCPTCNDSGDVHRMDGEWLGVCDCPAGTPFRAPAEPAEEETKAERDSEGIIRINGGRIVALSCDTREMVQRWFDIAKPGSKWQRDYAAALDLFDREAASSSVVPAPTETGPWQDISEAPKHLALRDKDGDKWTYDGDNWVTPETAILPCAYINRKYAPFVAAEEG